MELDTLLKLLHNAQNDFCERLRKLKLSRKLEIWYPLNGGYRIKLKHLNLTIDIKAVLDLPMDMIDDNTLKKYHHYFKLCEGTLAKKWAQNSLTNSSYRNSVKIMKFWSKHLHEGIAKRSGRFYERIKIPSCAFEAIAVDYWKEGLSTKELLFASFYKLQSALKEVCHPYCNRMRIVHRHDYVLWEELSKASKFAIKIFQEHHTMEEYLYEIMKLSE